MKSVKILHGGTAMNENEIGTTVLDAAFYLHKNPGHGLLESVYEAIITKLPVKKGLCEVIPNFVDQV
jgi:hypothetical protein